MKRKKILSTMCCVCLLAAFCFGVIQSVVFADGETNNVTCQFNGGTLNSTTGTVDYTINSQTISIELATKSGETYTKVNITNLQQSIDLNSASYYLKVTDTTNADLIHSGSALTVPADGYVLLNSSMFNNGVGIFELSAKQQQSGGDPQSPSFVLTAHFQGVETPVTMDENGKILIPDAWTSGTVEFYADDEKLNIKGINNIDEINRSITGTQDQIVISEDFFNYGKAGMHLEGTDKKMAFPMLITKDLINVNVSAPISMSYNFGSANVSQAIITKAGKTPNVSVFFGNTTAHILVTGYNVDKIQSISKANGSVNNDGTADIVFPALNKETSTQVELTILLKDGSTIKRTVNVVRTAITLGTSRHDKTLMRVTAGYVVNKGYLYENKSHDEAPFDAYLQVILYKDNTVVGFKQLKIDDKALVDKLSNNESVSKETFDEDAIVLFDGNATDANKACVFLTNGPIKSNSDTLPSVEYGIGAGVTIEWGEE